jgi:hypothetical protein
MARSLRTAGPLVLVVAAVAGGLSACGGSGWQPGSAPAQAGRPDSAARIAHPNGARAIVVSVSDGADGLTFTSAPWRTVGWPARFLLYGDGTVIVPASAQPGRIPALTTYRVTEKGIQAVLRQAEDAGLFADELDYGEPEILDVGTTFVTLRADDREIHHAAYALGLVDSVRGEQRRALSGFIDYVEAFAAARPDLLAEAPRPYEPESIDVFAWERDPDGGWNGSETRLAWPLRKPLAKLPAAELDADAGCGSIRSPEIARVARALTASETSGDSFPVWSSGRRSWFVAFDVNLPGELPCPRVGSAP